MRHYSCDICGNPMPARYERKVSDKSPAAKLCEVEDLCAHCARVGKEADFKSILKAAWKQAAEKADVLAEPEPTEKPGKVLRSKDVPQVKFSGRCGDEKRDWLEQLIKYNKEHGLGSLNKVAELAGSGVTADLLRSVVYDGIDPGMDKWRRIGQALNKLRGQEAAAE